MKNKMNGKGLNWKVYNKHYDKYIKQGELVFSNFSNNKKLFSHLKARRNDRIVDIGCGTGYFLEHLKKRGFLRLDGCELEGTALNYCLKERKGIVFGKIIGKRLPYKDGSFDIALSFDVIEHIPGAEKHFNEVFRILKNGGRYAFATPHKWVDAPMNFYRKGYFDIHCSLQTRSSIRKLALKNGFKKVEFINIDYELSPASMKKIPAKMTWLIPFGNKLMGDIVRPAIFGIAYKKI